MADISINYLGIKLDNPVIAGACNIWERDKKLVQAEEAGAAAIIYKSLFEEQIQLERLEIDEITTQYDERHAMMTDVFPEVEHIGPQQHLFRLKEVKKLIGIPVIASLNAVNPGTWKEYSKKIEDTGVDAIELNFYSMGRYSDKENKKISDDQARILEDVKRSISIPVSVKLSCFYDDPVSAIKQMVSAGADGFVLFNRLFQPDIDIEAEKHLQSFNLSNRGDYRLPLRFAGLLFDDISKDICCSSGIYSSDDVIKLLLAGATCIQTVSALYKDGVDSISPMVKGISTWMDKKGYKSISDFRGKLSNKKTEDPFIYKRAQYIDILMRPGNILKDRPI